VGKGKNQVAAHIGFQIVNHIGNPLARRSELKPRYIFSLDKSRSFDCCQADKADLLSAHGNKIVSFAEIRLVIRTADENIGGKEGNSAVRGKFLYLGGPPVKFMIADSRNFYAKILHHF